jgi:hypothetical protein
MKKRDWKKSKMLVLKQRQERTRTSFGLLIFLVRHDFVTLIDSAAFSVHIFSDFLCPSDAKRFESRFENRVQTTSFDPCRRTLSVVWYSPRKKN